MTRRCHVLVEGQTEQAFVNQTLAPHLVATGFAAVHPVIVATKRPAGGGKHRGGITNWSKFRREIELLTEDSSALVTTMVDFYGLPASTPGVNTWSASAQPPERVATVEAAIAADLDRPNLLVHVMLHEFETLVYVDPAAATSHLGSDQLERGLRADLLVCGSPEAVDDGPETAPSKRILAHYPKYGKVTDGPTITARIGIDEIRLDTLDAMSAGDLTEEVSEQLENLDIEMVADVDEVISTSASFTNLSDFTLSSTSTGKVSATGQLGVVRVINIFTL